MQEARLLRERFGLWRGRFDPSKHPRGRKGMKSGGRFVKRLAAGLALTAALGAAQQAQPQGGFSPGALRDAERFDAAQAAALRAGSPEVQPRERSSRSAPPGNRPIG